MAEFQEVVRQMIRLHKSCGCECLMDDDKQCPLYNVDDAPCEWINTAAELPLKQIEKAVMDWATEHPEPVYPTWGEWLAEIGLISWENNGDGVYSVMVPTFKMCTNIPADIAQKLGIEPKK